MARQDNPKEKISLPVEGLMQAQEEAVKYAEEFAGAPEGTVFWALTSNVPRTQEARFIFDMELGVIAKEIGDAVIIDLEGKMPDEFISGSIKNAGNKKIILINGPVHPGLGMHKYDLDEWIKAEKEFGSEENLISQWQNNPEIARRIGVDYEDVKRGFEDLLEDIKRTSKDIFPGREVWAKGLGHSSEIEIGLAAYAGKSVGEIIEKAGGSLIKTMESAHMARSCHLMNWESVILKKMKLIILLYWTTNKESARLLLKNILKIRQLFWICMKSGLLISRK